MESYATEYAWLSTKQEDKVKPELDPKGGFSDGGLELQTVSFVLRTGRALLSDISLRLAAGRVVGLIGPNGAGKTTLIRAMLGIVTPTGGRVVTLGEELGSAKWREMLGRVGYLPQDFIPYQDMTAFDTVAWVAWLKRVGSDKIRDQVLSTLDAVGLGPYASTPTRQLSGGMRRRVGIAQALVNSPDLLILDEPTGGLDPLQRASFLEIVRDMSSDRLVLIATHLSEDVVAVCDEFVLLDQGQLALRMTLGELSAKAEGTNSLASELDRQMRSVVTSS